MAALALEAPAEPPTLDGGLPLLGHLTDFFRDPVKLLRDGYNKRGPIFSFRMGGRRMVVLLGPDNNRFVFQETDKLLSIRESMPFFHKMFSPNFYSFAEMEEYLRQRAVIMPRFKASAMKQYVPVMAEESMALAYSLGDSGEFDLVQTLGPVVMDIAAHSFMGRDFKQKLGHEFFDLFRDFSGGMEFVLPLWVPTRKMRKSQAAKRKLHRILTDWIAERRRNPVEPADFFQDIVAATYPDGTPIPDELIIHMILLLVWAGHETTTGQVSWALIDILQNPGYRATLQQELQQILGSTSGADMSWDQAIAMQKMDLALRETERLHPVAFTMIRKAAADFEREGYQVHKGDWVLLAPSVSHRMSEVFTAPDEYRPERFDTERADAKVESNSLIGFGGGMHRCAGVNFARMEMKVLLAVLLQRYDMELIDEPRPIAGAGTYWPAQPCRVRYRRRKIEDAAPADVAALAAAAGCPAHAKGTA